MTARSCVQRASCPLPCYPAVNGLGWHIEELGPEGWAAPTGAYACPLAAKADLELIHIDNIERRIYEALGPTQILIKD